MIRATSVATLFRSEESEIPGTTVLMEVAIRPNIVKQILRKYFVEAAPTQMSFIRSVGLDKQIIDMLGLP